MSLAVKRHWNPDDTHHTFGCPCVLGNPSLPLRAPPISTPALGPQVASDLLSISRDQFSFSGMLCGILHWLLLSNVCHPAGRFETHSCRPDGQFAHPCCWAHFPPPASLLATAFIFLIRGRHLEDAGKSNPARFLPNLLCQQGEKARRWGTL